MRLNHLRGLKPSETGMDDRQGTRKVESVPIQKIRTSYSFQNDIFFIMSYLRPKKEEVDLFNKLLIQEEAMKVIG